TAADRFAQAQRLARVGARDDEKIIVFSGLHGSAQFFQLLIERDNLLALHMAAALGPVLVLEKHAGGAGPDQILYRAHDVDRIAVAGVSVDDDRRVGHSTDTLRRGDHFGLG